MAQTTYIYACDWAAPPLSHNTAKCDSN